MKKTILIIFIFFMQTLFGQSILFLGDSLTEGLGVSKSDSYPNLVEKLIKNKLKKEIKIINAGVSGSTTGDALSRIDWYLKRKPDIVFIALGANDGLRGLDLKTSEKNLEKIVQKSLNSGAKVLLAGMMIPPNYGPEYTKEFKNMYLKIKDKYKLAFLPFLLKDVAGEQKLNQADGIHPNEKGHKIIANEVFKFLKKEL